MSRLVKKIHLREGEHIVVTSDTDRAIVKLHRGALVIKDISGTNDK